MGMITCIVIPVIALVWLSYQMNKNKNAERLAMIEKGIVIEEPEKRANKYNALRNGLLMVGLAIGGCIGVFVNMLINSWEGGFLIGVFTLLGGGAGFVIYFFMARKMQKAEGSE